MTTDLTPITPAHSNKLLPWLGIALLVMVLDQITKLLIIGHFAEGASQYITSFFNLVRWHNKGAAFSFLANSSGWQRWFFCALGSIASLFIVWMLKRADQSTQSRSALALILGGAVGNVIDRFAYGYVVDFIQVHANGWHFPAFNVADSAISVGAALLILEEVMRLRRG
jgi:signal peptidase II